MCRRQTQTKWRPITVDVRINDLKIQLEGFDVIGVPIHDHQLIEQGLRCTPLLQLPTTRIALYSLV